MGKPFKIQLCFIGFGTNTFFETLWRLIVDRRKLRVMISHDLVFFSFYYKIDFGGMVREKKIGVAESEIPLKFHDIS